MNRIRILLVALCFCALVAAAFMLGEDETRLADQAEQESSTIPAASRHELAAGDIETPAREDKGQPKPAEEPANSIGGILLDDLGAPITTQFRVFARATGKSTFTRIKSHEDPSGRFELTGFEDGNWSIRASAKGYFPSAEVQVECLSNQPCTELRLELIRRPRIAGIVLTPDGLPAEKLDVRWHTATRSSTPRSSMRVRETDKPGSFMMENVGLGELTLHAEHDSWAPSESPSFVLNPGDEHLHLVLALREGGTILGQAYERDHSPARNWEVWAGPRDQDRNPYSQMVKTDEFGRFKFEHLAPDSYVVSLQLDLPDDSTPGSRDVSDLREFGRKSFSVPDRLGRSFNPWSVSRLLPQMLSSECMVAIEVADQSTTHIAFNPPPSAPVHVSGTILRAGLPVEGYWLGFASGESRSSLRELTQTDGKGRFEVALPGPGEYLVAALTPEKTLALETMQTIPARSRHTLNLVLPTGEIHGRLSNATKEPFERCKVFLRSDDGRFSILDRFERTRTATDDEGRFAFRGLAAGSYMLCTDGSRGSEGEQGGGIVVRHGIKLDPGQVLRGIALESKPGGVLRGEVLSLAGELVPGASIFLRDEAGRLVTQSGIRQYGSDAHFALGAIPPGNYQVSARTPQLVSSRQVSVEILEGQEARVSLQIGSGTVLEIHTPFDAPTWLSVRDEAGREYANLVGPHEAPDETFTKAFSSKRRKLGPLAPGKYTLSATTRDGRKASSTIRLNGEPTRLVSLD